MQETQAIGVIFLSVISALFPISLFAAKLCDGFQGYSDQKISRNAIRGNQVTPVKPFEEATSPNEMLKKVVPQVMQLDKSFFERLMTELSTWHPYLASFKNKYGQSNIPRFYHIVYIFCSIYATVFIQMVLYELLGKKLSGFLDDDQNRIAIMALLCTFLVVLVSTALEVLMKDIFLSYTRSNRIDMKLEMGSGKRWGDFLPMSPCVSALENNGMRLEKKFNVVRGVKELGLLLHEIKSQRNQFSNVDRVLFNDAWGLHPAEGVRHDMISSSIDEQHRLAFRDGGVHSILSAELQYVYDTIQAEELLFEKHSHSVQDKSNQIINLFLCDQLNIVNGQILRRKYCKEKQIGHYAFTKRQRILCWSLIVGGLILVLWFCFSFSLRQSDLDWLVSACLSLCCDIIVIIPIKIFLLDFTVPLSVALEVDEAKSRILGENHNAGSIEEGNQFALNNLTDNIAFSPTVFNALKYFSPGFRLATAHHDLPMVNFICKCSTLSPSPRILDMSYQRVPGGNFLQVSALFRHFLGYPYWLQDMLVKLVIVLLLAFLVVGYMICLEHETVFVIVPSLIVLVLLICLYVKCSQWCRRRVTPLSPEHAHQVTAVSSGHVGSRNSNVSASVRPLPLNEQRDTVSVQQDESAWASYFKKYPNKVDTPQAGVIVQKIRDEALRKSSGLVERDKSVECGADSASSLHPPSSSADVNRCIRSDSIGCVSLVSSSGSVKNCEVEDVENSVDNISQLKGLLEEKLRAKFENDFLNYRLQKETVSNDQLDEMTNLDFLNSGFVEANSVLCDVNDDQSVSSSEQFDSDGEETLIYKDDHEIFGLFQETMVNEVDKPIGHLKEKIKSLIKHDSVSKKLKRPCSRDMTSPQQSYQETSEIRALVVGYAAAFSNKICLDAVSNKGFIDRALLRVNESPTQVSAPANMKYVKRRLHALLKTKDSGIETPLQMEKLVLEQMLRDLHGELRNAEGSNSICHENWVGEVQDLHEEFFMLEHELEAVNQAIMDAGNSDKSSHAPSEFQPHQVPCKMCDVEDDPYPYHETQCKLDDTVPLTSATNRSHPLVEQAVPNAWTEELIQNQLDIITLQHEHVNGNDALKKSEDKTSHVEEISLQQQQQHKKESASEVEFIPSQRSLSSSMKPVPMEEGVEQQPLEDCASTRKKSPEKDDDEKKRADDLSSSETLLSLSTTLASVEVAAQQHRENVTEYDSSPKHNLSMKESSPNENSEAARVENAQQQSLDNVTEVDSIPNQSPLKTDETISPSGVVSNSNSSSSSSPPSMMLSEEVTHENDCSTVPVPVEVNTQQQQHQKEEEEQQQRQEQENVEDYDSTRKQSPVKDGDEKKMAGDLSSIETPSPSQMLPEMQLEEAPVQVVNPQQQQQQQQELQHEEEEQEDVTEYDSSPKQNPAKDENEKKESSPNENSEAARVENAQQQSLDNVTEVDSIPNQSPLKTDKRVGDLSIEPSGVVSNSSSSSSPPMMLSEEVTLENDCSTVPVPVEVNTQQQQHQEEEEQQQRQEQENVEDYNSTRKQSPVKDGDEKKMADDLSSIETPSPSQMLPEMQLEEAPVQVVNPQQQQQQQQELQHEEEEQEDVTEYDSSPKQNSAKDKKAQVADEFEEEGLMGGLEKEIVPLELLAHETQTQQINSHIKHQDLPFNTNGGAAPHQTLPSEDYKSSDNIESSGRPKVHEAKMEGKHPVMKTGEKLSHLQHANAVLTTMLQDAREELKDIMDRKRNDDETSTTEWQKSMERLNGVIATLEFDLEQNTLDIEAELRIGKRDRGNVQAASMPGRHEVKENMKDAGANISVFSDASTRLKFENAAKMAENRLNNY